MTPDELDVYARTVYGEARGEPVSGQIAVAWVIRNRVAKKKFGLGIIGVCKKPKQFSCWDDHNREVLEKVTLEDRNFLRIYGICALVWVGYFPDLSSSACWYHTKDVHPYWEKDLEQCADIGQHVFFKEKV